MLVEALLMLASATAASDLPVDLADEGKIICKRMMSPTSRITNHKICKTVKEWQRERKEYSEVLREQRGGRGLDPA